MCDSKPFPYIEIFCCLSSFFPVQGSVLFQPEPQCDGSGCHENGNDLGSGQTVVDTADEIPAEEFDNKAAGGIKQQIEYRDFSLEGLFLCCPDEDEKEQEIKNAGNQLGGKQRNTGWSNGVSGEHQTKAIGDFHSVAATCKEAADAAKALG